MKVFSIAIAFVFAMSTAIWATNDLPSGVDVSKSTVEWYASKVTGKHNGTINLKNADLNFNDGKLEGGSFTVDMTSIAVTDLKGDMKGKLEGHLKSDDFFGVANFPEATFTITSVEAADGGYNVTGDMSIKENTHPVSFMVTMDGGMAKASITLDRTNYDVRYGSKKWFPNIGDKMIHDEFKLEVSLALTES